MITVTKASALSMIKALGKDKVAVGSIDLIINTLSIDPNLANPKVDAVVVSNEDFKSKKVKAQFLDACKVKHPSNRVIYLSKINKLDPDFNRENGIDKVLMRPSQSVLAEEIYSVVDNLTNKGTIESRSDKVEVIEKYTPTPEPVVIPKKQEEVEVIQEPVVEELPIEEFPIEQSEPVEMVSLNSTADRIKAANSVAAVQCIVNEMSSAEIVKNLAKENSQYSMFDDRLKAISAKINSILVDPAILSFEDKLGKIRALFVDQDYYRTKTNTILEQRVEEIILTITERMDKLLRTRLSQLDEAIYRAAGMNKQDSFDRLAGLNEERANVILELIVLSQEITNIFSATDSLATNIAGDMVKDAVNIADNPLISHHLKARGENIASATTVESAMNILRNADKHSVEFEDAIRDVNSMLAKVNKLIDLDKETIIAQRQMIEYLRANNVEDTVIAETILKKSLRAFVGPEGVGRTVIPLLLSNYKSRQNNNVLHVDVTGVDKLSDYGIDAIDIHDFMENRREDRLVFVNGKIDDSSATIQRLLTCLTKAADFYSVVNIVMSPEQMDLFKTILPDIKCVNYITDTNLRNLTKTKELIEETRYENVAQRVLINKSYGDLEVIVKHLGLYDRVGVHILSIPNIPAITECQLRGIAPQDVSSIETSMKEVIQYV